MSLRDSLRDRLPRDHWQRRIAALDPATDYVEIMRILGRHEFPWDITQALGFALYRTYAIPSIGALLGATGEFTERTQKRYDDTGLVLDAVLEHGFEDPRGRAGVRRMNQMHGAYAIPNEDMRYVLCTFVAVPIRWIDDYGYRPLSEAERTATANYYRHLGRLMNIKDIPETWREFGEVMDAEEAERFAFDPGGTAVSDATITLAATFPPTQWVPERLFRRFAVALMDRPLREAFHYPSPSAAEERLFRGALKARGRALRRFPARRAPLSFGDLPQVRSYPGGVRTEALGTFPTPAEVTRARGGCPVPGHGMIEA